MKTALASFVAVWMGVWVLWSATDGGRAFTAEGARRLAVQQQPRDIPGFVLQDQQGRFSNLEQFKGKIVVLDFIYTRCADLCIAVGNTLQSIRDALPPATVGKRVVFVSISFDPRRDSPERLNYYARRHQARYDHWRVARVAREEVLDRLLEIFGVKVIPDRWGGYQHNAAVYILDREGRLVRIFDYDDPERVTAYLKEQL